MNKPDISIIILTYNEELHIERCIKNLQPIAQEIFIVDFFLPTKPCRLQNHWELKFFNVPGKITQINSSGGLIIAQYKQAG